MNIGNEKQTPLARGVHNHLLDATNCFIYPSAYNNTE